MPKSTWGFKMPCLHELQSGFADALAGRGDGAAAWIEDRGLEGAARLAIYRHAVQATRARTLIEGYPTVHALVGTEYFEYLAQHYGERFPSRSGNLQGYGAHFPVFLDAFAGAPQLGYLADCARLDGVRVAAALAADAQPVDAEACAAAAAVEPARLLVRMHPSVHICRSEYPVLTIQRWCESPDQDAPCADPRRTQVLVWRDGGEVATAEIEAAPAVFIESLCEGADVASAAAAGDALDPGFNFAITLGDVLARQLIVGFNVKETST